MRLTLVAGKPASATTACGACHAPQAVTLPPFINRTFAMLAPSKAQFTLEVPGEYICPDCWRGLQATLPEMETPPCQTLRGRNGTKS